MGSISEAPTKVRVGSMFSTLPEQPPDGPFAVNAAYKQDCNPQKVNLGIGVYRDSDGNPWPLRVVQEAEKALFQASDIHRHEYLAIQGDTDFLSLAADLVFGFDDYEESSMHDAERLRERVVSIQTVLGTGANRLGAELLARNIRPGCVWIPKPTWANHYMIWDLAGVPKKEYPYYDSTSKAFDFDGTFRTLSTHAKANDVVILHACAHNPTGADPSKSQWKLLAQLCKEKGIIPFFDLAYQGFASGDAKKDAWAVRHFFHDLDQVEFCVAQSFSKNFGLYGQRVGALHVALSSKAPKDVSSNLLGNLCQLVRGEYSMAPRHGAEIVKTVLGSKELRKKWLEDLTTMSERILQMRHALFDELVKLSTPGDWNHIINQIGMFTYIGLTPSQVSAITEKHHIYMLRSGRISISGLNETNVQYVAKAIDEVVRTVD
ncbi:pyridoxal phosphate-dependent transferase [Penicillium maclennaniae]|uniref:pyridoxal phosphate-dependent transferase n=1 Tax=Penicillium maclennaniae TaxID=1343394 RepID=UPI0025426725|nr:pyridoxal phosphate-dependent transferase [Penicillium maclennaniae]KAJ5675156.1 pyridoxal phosphate-dependent transferase [Penicillium maclennaniae]